MSEPAPADLLARIRTVYRTCRTYRDRGSATSESFAGDPPRKSSQSIPFETALVRPTRFRFEYRDLWMRAHMLLLADHGRIRSSWTATPGVESLESVHVGLGAHAGVSHGVSAIVPRLLLPDPTQPDPLPSASRARMLGTEGVAGQECFVVRGARGENHVCTFWFGAEDLLLRRMAESVRFPGKFEPSRSETVITYEPALDVDLSDELFTAPAEWDAGPGR